MNDIPKEAGGFSLCVIRRRKGGEQLDVCEGVHFKGGYAAVDTLFRRAQIYGWVGKFGQSVGDGCWFADLLDASGDTLDVIPMSREAWNYLKRVTKARIVHG